MQRRTVRMVVIVGIGIILGLWAQRVSSYSYPQEDSPADSETKTPAVAFSSAGNVKPEKISQKLDEVLDKEDQILKKLDAVMEELRVIKIRASQRH